MDAVAESPSPASTGEGDYLPATILPPTCHLLTGMLYFIGHNRYLQAIILLCVCEDVYKSPAANYWHYEVLSYIYRSLIL